MPRCPECGETVEELDREFTITDTNASAYSCPHCQVILGVGP